jgi:Domain of unknown function (DUF4304)
MAIWQFGRSASAQPKADYSAAAEVAKIQEGLFPAFREIGFSSDGRSFNRSMPGGIIQTVHFLTMPATSSLYGQFAINVGVFLPELWDFFHGALNAKAPKVVADHHCELRHRVKPPGVEQHSDLEWEASANSNLVNVARSTVLAEAETFFDRLSDRSRIKTWLEGFPLRAPDADRPAPILLAAMDYKDGFSEKARERLQEYLAIISQQPNRHLGHENHIRELIESM